VRVLPPVTKVHKKKAAEKLLPASFQPAEVGIDDASLPAIKSRLCSWLSQTLGSSSSFARDFCLGESEVNAIVLQSLFACQGRLEIARNFQAESGSLIG
jgi:hypothetical protein